MKRICLYLFALSLSLPVMAQPPVRLKLIGAFWDGPGKYKYDTLWFGMQADGALGFQEGLDVEDTAIKKLWCTIDTVAPRRFLKTNVLPFNFKTYTKIEVFHDINLKYIKWDTSELYPYQYRDKYEYISVSLLTYNLRLGEGEKYSHLICSRKDLFPDNDGINPCDSVNIFNWSVGKLWLTLGLECYKNVSCETNNNQSDILLQYLPENRECKVFLKNIEANSLTVYNLMGQEVLRITHIENKEPIPISFEGLASAFYCMVVSNGSQTQSKTIFAY